MNTRTPQLAKGLISLVFMLMLAAALVAGQARANLPGAAASPVRTESGRHDGLLLTAETLERISSFPALLGSAIPLPASVRSSLGLLKPADAGQRPDRSPLL